MDTPNFLDMIKDILAFNYLENSKYWFWVNNLYYFEIVSYYIYFVYNFIGKNKEIQWILSNALSLEAHSPCCVAWYYDQ